MVKNYFKVAYRNCINQKFYSGVSIVSLSVAIATSLLIMMWVQNELRFDLYHPDSNEIFLVKNHDQTSVGQETIWESSPYPLSATISSGFPEVDLVTQLYRSYEKNVRLEVEGRYLTENNIIYLGENWFKVFQYDFIEGTPQGFFQHPNSLILTESKARTWFGQTTIMGKTMKVDSTEFVVRGVVRDNPVNSSFQFDVMIPIAARLDTKLRRMEADNWLYSTHRTFVKLKKTTDPTTVAAKINRVYNQKRESNKLSATLLPIGQLHFESDFISSQFVHGNKTTVKIFTMLAVVLLLAAGINYVNLCTARTSIRSKEIGIRKIAGASRIQLFVQIITENTIVSLVSLLAALGIVKFALAAFNNFTEKTFAFDLTDLPTFGLIVGIWLSVMLLISVYPALLLSSINPLSLFKGVGLLRLKNSSVQHLLTIAQFSMAVIMIIGSVIVYRQLTFMQSRHSSGDRSAVFTIQVPDERVRFSSFEESVSYHDKLRARLEAFKQGVLQLASTKHVSRLNMESVITNAHATSGGLDWEGRPADFNPSYISYDADADLNKILRLQFVAGRWFDSKINTDKDNVILNEEAVKQFGLTHPVVGKRFKKGHIIGVVKDFYHKNLHEKIEPVVMRIDNPNMQAVLVESNPGQVINALKQTEDVYKKYFPHQIFRYAFADQEFEKLYREDKKALTFTVIFASLTVFISCMGLLAMVTLTTTQRRREIGIRKTLGASVAGLVAMLSKDFLKLVLIAIVIAVPTAWFAATKWLADFAYRTELNWWIFAFSSLVALSCALCTLCFQSTKTALMDPVKSLSSE